MKKATRKLLSAVLMLIFAVSTVLLLRQMRDSANGDKAYREAQQLAGLAQEDAGETQTEPVTTPLQPTQPEISGATEPETVPETEPEILWVPAAPEEEDPWITELEKTDLSALRQVNEDVIGWILIPGTKINYPIVQGEDNGYYLNHLWDGKTSSAGSIFMECTDSADFSDFHTILYGHNMNDGSMFSNLHYYDYQSYLAVNPYVYLVTDSGVYRYEIYGAHTIGIDNYVYALNLTREDQKERLIGATLEESVIDAGVTPAVTDRILTLSTCDGAQSVRWVIHARLEMIPTEQ